MSRLAAPPIHLTESEQAEWEQLVRALACAPPEQYGCPISHWSARELAENLTGGVDAKRPHLRLFLIRLKAEPRIRALDETDRDRLHEII